MGRYKISGLSGEEKEHLVDCLKDYRAKQKKRKITEQFYKGIMDAYGFDAVGRFTSHFETGLERIVWVISDERKEGYNTFIEYEVNEGDEITLLSEQGIPIRAPITLDERSAGWAEYHEMCALLGIDPKDDFKYYIGLTRNKKQ